MRNISYIVGLLLALAACNNANRVKPVDTLTSGVISVAVDESFTPVIAEEIAAFENRFSQAVIIPLDTSETDAIKLLLADSVRLAITTRTLSASEEKQMRSRKFQPRSHLLALDGIALTVNRENPDTLITVGQLRKILLGGITRWEQIYPNSKLGEISLVFDNPTSSTVRYMIDSICGGAKLAEHNLYAQKNNRSVLNYVSQDKAAIGVIGVSWLSNKQDSTNLSFDQSVRVMSVSNEVVATPDNSFKPYQYYLYYGYYPLVRKVFIIHNDTHNGLATGFTRFLTGDIGQRIILKAGIVPATQPVRIVHITE